MLEEKHNFKSWLYLSPALVLLLIFTFYPIFNAFNLVFLYNYDYMQRRIDGYTFSHHDPNRAEQWAYRDHWNAVTDLAVSDDGYVYSASGGFSLHVTDLRGRSQGTFLALDPEKLITINDQSITESEFPGEEMVFTAFYVDNLLNIYAALHDETETNFYVIRISVQGGVWDIRDSYLTTHTDSITSIVFTSNNRFYTASQDGTVIRHDFVLLNNAVETWVYSDHTGGINAIHLNVAETSLYTASLDNSVHKIDVNDGTGSVFATHTAAVTGVVVDEQDNVYTSSLDNTIRSYAPTGVERYQYTYTEGFTTVSVNRDRVAYAGAVDGTIHRITTDGERAWMRETHIDSIHYIALDTRARTNAYTASADGTMVKINAEGDVLWRHTGHEDEVFGAHVDVRNRLYSISSDGVIYRAETLTADSADQLVVFANFDSRVFSVATDDENFVYVGLEDGSVNKLNSEGSVIESYHGQSATIQDLVLGEDGYIYSVSIDGSIHKLDTDLVFERSYAYTAMPLTVAVDAEGNLHVGYISGVVRKLDTSGTELWIYNDHTARINGIAIDEDGNVYTASDDFTVHKIDSDGENVWIFSEHTDKVNDVVVDEDGRIYSVSDDETLRRIRPNGNEFWVYTNFSSTTIDTIRIKALTLDNENNIYFGTSENFAARGSLVPSVRRINEATRISVFHNFMNTFQSDLFVRAIINTLIIVFVSVPVSVIISLLLSVWLNSIKRLQGFFQTVFFLPYVTNAIAIGMAFAVIFHRDNGLMNYVLTQVFGMEQGLEWLGRVTVDPESSGITRFLKQYLNLPMLSLLVFITWGGLAFKIMVFLSGLQSIDKQYYDAARVDSTPRWRIFRRITVPLLSPMIAYITITSFIGAFKEYTAIVGMFGIRLGPAGDNYRLVTIVGLVYRSLDDMNVPGKLSEAAATAIILFFMTLVLTLFNMYVSKKRVHY